MDPLAATEKVPTTANFSISSSRSALHQSLSFPKEGDLPEGVDTSSSTSCANEGEQERKEEQPVTTVKSPSATGSSFSCSILLSFSNFPTSRLPHNVLYVDTRLVWCKHMVLQFSGVYLQYFTAVQVAQDPSCNGLVDSCSPLVDSTIHFLSPPSGQRLHVFGRTRLMRMSLTFHKENSTLSGERKRLRNNKFTIRNRGGIEIQISHQPTENQAPRTHETLQTVPAPTRAPTQKTKISQHFHGTKLHKNITGKRIHSRSFSYRFLSPLSTSFLSMSSPSFFVRGSYSGRGANVLFSGNAQGICPPHRGRRS